MNNPNGLNGTTYIQQNPQQLFQGQPNQQQFVQGQQQPQQQQFNQGQQPQQQQVVQGQQQQQPQQVVVQQPSNYQNGQVSMNGQNFSTNELSPKAQEVFDMIQGVNKMALSNGNVQQQQGMINPGNVVYQQLPNGQIVPMIMNQQQPVPIQQPQQQDQGMFSGWKGKAVLVGVGGLAGYGISKMMGSGPSTGDVAALTNGVQVLSQASSSDIMKALFG